MGGIVSKNKKGENEDDSKSVLTDEQIEILRKKQLERELKQMEKQLMSSYDKWDENKRINHEGAMALFDKFNNQSN